MKTILCMTVFALCGLKSEGQSKRVDSLINLLNNNEIKADGNYFGPIFYLSDGPGTELIKIGKAVTEKLLHLLSDSTKGVVAHYVLTDLWNDSIPVTRPIYIEKEDLTVFTFNELSFFIQRGKVYANNYDLKTNATLWEIFLKDKR